MLQSDTRAFNLALAGLVAQLPVEFGALRETGGAEWVALGDETTGRIDHVFAAIGVVAVFIIDARGGTAKCSVAHPHCATATIALLAGQPGQCACRSFATLSASAPSVAAASPGWCRTDMGGDRAPLSRAEGADIAVWLATLPDDGPTGQLFSATRRRGTLQW